MLYGTQSTFLSLNRIKNDSLLSISNSLERLSSGLALNSASDDPSAILQATRMQTEASSWLSAMGNAQYGLSYSQTAKDSYNDVLYQLEVAKSLAESATSRLISGAQRTEIQTVMDEIMQNISNLKSTASYDGTNVFGSGAVGSVTTTVTEKYTSVEAPSVDSGSNNYAILSSNVDQGSIEVRNATGDIIAHTVDQTNISEGYIRVDFAETNSTVSFQNPVSDTYNIFAIDFVTSNTTPVPGATVINNAAEFANIASDMSGDYILAADIDLSGFSGFASTFTGTLNGNGFTLSNFSNTSEGLFTTTSGATIENIKLDNFTVSNGNTNSGVLIGQDTSSTIKNIKVTNSSLTSTNTNSNKGGLIGSASGSTISYIEFQGSVTTSGGNQIGGVIGTANNVDASFITANVTINASASDYVGGFAGLIQNNSVIDNVLANINNSSAGDTAGGFVGNLTTSSTISRSRSIGNLTVTNGSEIGGFVGYNNAGSISDSSTSVNINAIGDLSTSGGFAGYNNGSIQNSKSQGNINANNVTAVGGFVGYSTGSISNSLSDTDITLSNDSTMHMVGGFAGEAMGTTITGSVATGNITNPYANSKANTVTDVGGFIGEATGMTITASSTTSNVSLSTTNTAGGSNNIGGFAGYLNASNVSESFSDANVSLFGERFDDIGGFVGESNSVIDNVYYGELGTVTLNNNTANNVGGFIGRMTAGTITDSYTAGQYSPSATVTDLGEFGGSRSGGTVTNSAYLNNEFGSSGDWGVGSTGGLTALSIAQFEAGSSTAPISGWGTEWAKPTGDTPWLVSAKTASDFSQASMSPITAKISTNWDPNSTIGDRSTSIYNNVSDKYNTSSSFTAGGTNSEILFGNADDTYIGDVTVKLGGTTLVEGTDYDWFVRDNGSQYSLMMLNDTYNGQSLDLSYDVVYNNLDTVYMGEETVSYDVTTSGTETFDTINSYGLQVGIDGTANSQSSIQSFALDLGALHLGVSSASDAEVALQSINDAIDHIEVGLIRAEGQEQLLTNIMDGQYKKYQTADESFYNIAGVDEAAETANAMAEQLKYETSLYMMSFLSEMNYSRVEKLLGVRSTSMSNMFMNENFF